MRSIVLIAPLAVLSLARTSVAAPRAPAPDRTELGFFPVVGGDSDVGVTLGAAGSLARFRPGSERYDWRLEAVAITSFEPDPEGVRVTFQDYFLALDATRLAGERLGGELRLAFTRFDDGQYSGLGNDAGDGSREPEFGLRYPSLRATARLRAWRSLHLIAGAHYQYVWVEVHEDERLARALAEPTPLEARLLVGTSEHAVASLVWGIRWDSRNDDISPSAGSRHELTLRAAPAVGGAARWPHAGLNLSLQRYVGLAGERLVAAARFVTDVVLGDAPFYELARARDGTAAPGGGESVRGVPAYRYFGQVKTYGNLELRAATRPYRVLGQAVRLGGVAFADAGRVFAELARVRAVTPGTLGLKVGLGAGLRVQWGESFILRADLAWSPEADPIAVYFNVNHLF